YSNYFALIMLVVIVVFMFINPETQISVAVGAAVLIIAALIYVVKHQKDK
ncbi:MAG: amino acid permease, partial [Lactobacillus crispatus]|nr:amino acid permease [Lactobacillus crispatus]